MAKVLVTGGAGFIGSHLVDALIATRHRVMVVDDLSSGKSSNLPYDVEVVREDVRSPRMRSVFRDFRPEYVFHLAAQKNLQTSIRDPLFDAQVNIDGSLNVIEQSRNFRIKKFIFSSSAAVYGMPARLPITETAVFQPASPYGIAKATIEHYLEFYRHQYGLPSVSLCYSNVYGPRQDAQGEGGVVAMFVKKIMNRQSLSINGHGRQTRDFIFVADVVRANLLAMSKRQVVGRMNISTSTQTSINTLAKILLKLSGSPVRLKHGPALPGDVMKNALSWNQAQRQLKWKPEVKLEAGLLATWKWATEAQP